MIDVFSDRSFYKQLADLLRAQIKSGELAAGAPLPSEKTLGQTYGLARPAVRAAIAVLRSEGLVSTARGLGTRVREQFFRQTVILRFGDRLTARCASDQERSQLNLDYGVPVLEIIRVGGSTELHPGDLVEITVNQGPMRGSA